MSSPGTLSAALAFLPNWWQETADSAAFDDRGRTLVWKDNTTSGTWLVQLRLPPASARTPYDRLGDYVPWVAVGITAIAAITGLAAGRRRRAAGTAAGSAADVMSDIK